MEDKDFNNEEDKIKRKSSFNKKAFKFNPQPSQHKDEGSGIDWDSFKFELPTQTTPQSPTPTPNQTNSQDVMKSRFSLDDDIPTPSSNTATSNSPKPQDVPQVSTSVPSTPTSATPPYLEPTHLFTEAPVSSTATHPSPAPSVSATHPSPAPSVSATPQSPVTQEHAPVPSHPSPVPQEHAPVPSPPSPSTTPTLDLLSGGDGLEELMLCITVRALQMEVRGMRNYTLTIAENYAPISSSGGYMNTTICNLNTRLFTYLILSEEWVKSSISPLTQKLRMFRDCIDVRYSFSGIYHSYAVIQKDQMYVLTFKDTPVRKDKLITLTLINRETLERMWRIGLKDVQPYVKSVSEFKPGDYLLMSDGTLTPYDNMRIARNQIVVVYEEVSGHIIPTYIKYLVSNAKGDTSIAEVPFTPLTQAASSWGLKIPEGYRTHLSLNKVSGEFNTPPKGESQYSIRVEKYTPKLVNIIPMFTDNFNKKKLRSYTLLDKSPMVVYLDEKKFIIGVQYLNEYHIDLLSPEEARTLESGNHDYTLEQKSIIAACIRDLTSTPNTSSLLTPNDDDMSNPTFEVQAFLTPNKPRRCIGVKHYTYDGKDANTRSDADWCAEVFCDKLSDMVYSAGDIHKYVNSVRSKYKPAVYSVEQFNQLRED